MNQLISVIIPVYNVESYLKRCIDSIINQSYENLEIILINDGSTDNSRLICEEYAKKDTRIILVNQENNGSSIARNTGLDKATGDIISFIDSDDYVEISMLKEMVKLLIENDLDVVEISPSSSGKQKTYNHRFIIEDVIHATQRIIRSTSFSVWRRIYKKELIEDMRFIPKIIHQDVFFTIDVLKRTNKIGYLNSPLYTYNKEGVSIIRSKYSAHKRDIAIRATEYIKENVTNHPAIKKAVNNYIVFYYTDHYFLISRNTFLDKDKAFRRKLKKEIFKAINLSNIRFRSFLVLVLPKKIVELISTSFQSYKAKLT